MPIVSQRKSRADHFHMTSEGHNKTVCYGAKSWGKVDSRPIGEFVYRVEGVPQSERDEDTNEDGWWCEACCRQRGWIW
jgi:hypothetical protein